MSARDELRQTKRRAWAHIAYVMVAETLSIGWSGHRRMQCATCREAMARSLKIIRDHGPAHVRAEAKALLGKLRP